MSSDSDTPGQAGAQSRSQKPDWADGLRQLYDSVVDEPLPDAFKDLLEKLDGDGDKADGSDGSQS
ncbi:MAG: NepR family anti-sigma factor [Pseudomonadota bacterium]